MTNGGDGLEVDTTALRKAGEGFHTGANGLQGIKDRLKGRLAAEGKCWGQDKTGSQFEGNYAPAEKDVLDLFDEFVKGLNAINKGVDLMAKNYKKAEDASEVR